MRIALLTDSDAFAGTERHIHDLDASLRARGVDVRVCCPATSPLAGSIIQSGGRLTPIEKGGGVDVPAIRALAAQLKCGEIDLIHAHNGRSSLIAAAAKRLAGRGKAVLTQHFLAPAYVGRKGIRGLASRTVHHWVDRQLDHVFAISNAVRQAALNRGEADASKITTVHNGIRAPVPSTNLEAVRRELGVDESALLVLTAARLDREKRIDVLINSWREIAQSVPQAICVVAGVGSQQAALQRQIDESGLSSRFRLLGFRDDVIDLMAICHVFVLPSDAEPFGLALVEAMALGRCVIATDAGGPREIVEHEISGLLAAPADAASLSRALLKVLGSASLRQSLGEAATQRFFSHFRSERMARQIDELYAQVLGLSAQPASSALAM